MTINLTKVRDVLDEVDKVVEHLDGIGLDETNSLRATKSVRRDERAAVSRELQFLATRLELAAALARSEYWTSRGYTDHIYED